MGLRPREVDQMTPAEFASCWRVWKRMNVRADDDAATMDAPTDDEVAAYRQREAELMALEAMRGRA
jgi:hypothetical protein